MVDEINTFQPTYSAMQRMRTHLGFSTYVASAPKVTVLVSIPTKNFSAGHKHRGSTHAAVSPARNTAHLTDPLTRAWAHCAYLRYHTVQQWPASACTHLLSSGAYTPAPIFITTDSSISAAYTSLSALTIVTCAPCHTQLSTFSASTSTLAASNLVFSLLLGKIYASRHTSTFLGFKLLYALQMSLQAPCLHMPVASGYDFADP